MCGYTMAIHNFMNISNKVSQKVFRQIAKVIAEHIRPLT